jgi:hypothetical protein
MKPKLLVYLILLAFIVIAAWLRSHQYYREYNRNRHPQEVVGRGFDRSVSWIEYTRHARCRMECRHITQKEVEDIMKNGMINYRKSDANDLPCPTYALEGYTSEDNQHVRIVFAQCNNKTKVVTCIDLDHDYPCACN